LIIIETLNALKLYYFFLLCGVLRLLLMQAFFGSRTVMAGFLGPQRKSFTMINKRYGTMLQIFFPNFTFSVQ
jgi:hypothetical protein